MLYEAIVDDATCVMLDKVTGEPLDVMAVYPSELADLGKLLEAVPPELLPGVAMRAIELMQR